MADISATKEQTRAVPNDFQTPVERVTYDISPVTDGVYTQATHTLISVPAGKAVIGGRIVVQESLGGTGATLDFALNSVALTGQLTKAGFTAGKVIEFVPNAVTVEAGPVFYAVSVAITLTMAVGTADLTAGRFFIQLDLLDVGKLLSGG